MRKYVEAFLGVSGQEKDGRVQFAVRGSNFAKSLEENDNYKKIPYTSTSSTGGIILFYVGEETDDCLI